MLLYFRPSHSAPPRSRSRYNAPTPIAPTPRLFTGDLDLRLLKQCQDRVDGISPDDFGLRWFVQSEAVCLYGARDVDVPYDHFVRTVDIIGIQRRVLRGAPMDIGRVDRTTDEYRVWTQAPRAGHGLGGVVEQGYLAFRRRPDGGVRIVMLTRRGLRLPTPPPLIGTHRWLWLRAYLDVKAFRCLLRRTIGTAESLYAGPPLHRSH